jgi:porphobilinogen synthase
LFQVGRIFHEQYGGVLQMYFPKLRPRRLRQTATLRKMVRETSLAVCDMIYPMFVSHGHGVKTPVPSMPGVFQFSVDVAVQEAVECASLGLPGIILFGLPAYKDETGSSAFDPEEAVQQAVKAIKNAVPELIVITDVCLCGYTSHGHCGLLNGNIVQNDATLEVLARVALSHARAGADVVAPSDMMDGRVGAIRKALDENGFEQVAILSYAVKYASAFYGPFRDAADSAPMFGDRRSYQMDSANIREAIKEVQQDLDEGADIVMVKPALAYLDVIRAVKEMTTIPVATYNVSGEYAMVKAAANNGWLNEKDIVMEMLLSMKRAGADLILTYFAKDVARWLKETD